MQNHAADIPTPIDTCTGLEFILVQEGYNGMRWTYSQKFSDAYDADATVALDCTTTRPLVASATTPGCGGEPPRESSSCSTCDGLAFIASAEIRCTVGQHISALWDGDPPAYYGATIESIDSDANIIVVAWDAGDATHTEVAFAQATDDSGALACRSSAGICTGCLNDADNTPITQDNVGNYHGDNQGGDNPGGDCSESDGCAGCAKDGNGNDVQGATDCVWNGGECFRTDGATHCEPNGERRSSANVGDVVPPAEMCIHSVNACIPAASEPTSQTLTCQSIKTAYKSQSCCNNPNNPFTVPTSSARRLLRSAPSGDSQVVDLVVSKLSNWNTLLNKGLISAQEYSTRRTRLLESLA